MNQMIEHITGRSLNSVKNPEVRILMEVAKEYKPLRDWLKRLYETYGAVQVPGKVRVDNNRFVINNSELA